MKYHVNDQVRYNGEAHTVESVTVTYHLDGVPTPVKEADIAIIPTEELDKVTIQWLCELITLPYNDIVGKSRQRTLALARSAIAHLLRTKMGWTYTRIAKALNRTHGSIIFGINTYTDLLYVGDTYAEELRDRLADLAL